MMTMTYQEGSLEASVLEPKVDSAHSQDRKHDRDDEEWRGDDQDRQRARDTIRHRYIRCTHFPAADGSSM